MIAVPRINRTSEGDRVRFITDPTAGARLVIVTLDVDQLQHQMLEPLVAKYFGDGSMSEYLVSIARRDPPSLAPSSASSGGAGALGEIVYSSASPPLDAARADVTTGMFDLRMDELSRLADSGGEGTAPALSARMSIAIIRRTAAADGTRVLMSGGEHQGAWELLAEPG